MLTVYRATPAQYAGDLSGEGARLYGGRWNQRGTPALYASPNVSLALLENLVHIEHNEDFPKSYTITVVEVEAEGTLSFVDDLPPNREASQRVGTASLRDADCLGFWVPSIIVQDDRNLILNPRCRLYARSVRVRETYLQPVDQRLNR